jgi:hypothetical protein
LLGTYLMSACQSDLAVYETHSTRLLEQA